MKKVIIIISIFIFIIILFLSQVGFQIGNVRIGKKFELKTVQVKNFVQSSFYKDYYKSDKLIVLNIWATWCVPCIGEIPELNSVQTIYKDNNVTFLSLSIDNDTTKLSNFIKNDKFKYTDITFDNLKYRDAILNTLEGNEVGNNRSIESVPVTYLLKGKKIVTKIDGTIEKNELIKLINLNK